jgi:hypothetical protein
MVLKVVDVLCRMKIREKGSKGDREIPSGSMHVSHHQLAATRINP